MNIDEKEHLLKYTFEKLSEAPKLVETHLKHIHGHRNAYFELKKHADNFMKDENSENAERLIVLPGLRGVGKTTIVFQIYNYLTNEKKIPHDRILYFSADELKAYLDKKILDVIDTFIRYIHRTSPTYLEEKLFIFVDEAHYDPEWSETAKVLFDKNRKIFMIFTGSSALSLELNVDAARRATKEIVFPMNFSEYLILKWGLILPKDTSESVINLIFHSNDDLFVENAILKETELIKKLLSLKIRKPIEEEWNDFVCFNGFPFTLNITQTESHEKIYDMVERVVEKDVFSIHSFNINTRNIVFRILSFLALQPPGGTSDAKLSKYLGVSPTLVQNILNAIENARLIFSIKPYGGAGKTIRKPWKYYFLSPSINAAMRSKLGHFNISDRHMFGVLLETLVASSLIRMKETSNPFMGIFYDPQEEGVDFLIHDGEGNIIPIEVGYGEKNKRQIEKAIEKYNSKWGVIVSECKRIKKEGNLVYIPFTIFSFI